jgi:type II secretory pathway pseudopilin PulG
MRHSHAQIWRERHHAPLDLTNDSLDEPMLKYRTRGFTIVKLLIVIVGIAILAAITVVAYSGIQNRARASGAQAAARQAASAIASYAVQSSDQYPANAAAAGLTDSGSTTHQYRVDNSASPRTFCVTATTNNISYYSSSTSSSPTAGACAGHGANGGSTATNLALSTSPNSTWTVSVWGGGAGTFSIVPNAGVPGNAQLSAARQQVTSIPTNEWGMALGSSGSSAIPVQAGNEYTASVYLRTSLGTHPVGMNFDWLNSSGTKISSAGAARTASGTTGWQRRSYTAVAPAVQRMRAYTRAPTQAPSLGSSST